MRRPVAKSAIASSIPSAGNERFARVVGGDRPAPTDPVAVFARTLADLLISADPSRLPLSKFNLNPTIQRLAFECAVIGDKIARTPIEQPDALCIDVERD